MKYDWFDIANEDRKSGKQSCPPENTCHSGNGLI